MRDARCAVRGARCAVRGHREGGCVPRGEKRVWVEITFASESGATFATGCATHVGRWSLVAGRWSLTADG
jgi:hypothetical protein